MAVLKRDELLKCLASVEAGLSAKDELEQSSCYALRDGRMWTFNDDVACSVEIPPAMKSMECAVPAAEFRSLLSRMDEDELDVSLSGDEGQLLLKTKRRRAGIRVQLKVIMPVDEVEVPADDEWKKLPDGFAEAIATVSQVAGRSEQLFVLCCVHVTSGGLEACDNYQAIRYKMKTGLDQSVLMKRDGVEKAAKLDVEEWALSKSWVHFRGASGLTVSVRRWNQDYPKLGPLMEVEGVEGSLPKGLEAAVRKAEVFVSTRDDSVGLSVDLNSSRLLLRAEGSAGWYEERQKSDYGGEPILFRIAPRLLREVCRRSSRATIGKEKLKVTAERYVYVSCLAVSEDGEK